MSAIPQAVIVEDETLGDVNTLPLPERLPRTRQILLERSARCSLHGLFIMAILLFIHFNADIIYPIIVAFFITILFGPLVEKLARNHVYRGISAFIIICIVPTLMIGTVAVSIEPVADWLSRAPTVLPQARDHLETLQEPLGELDEAARALEQLSPVAADDVKVMRVELDEDSMVDRIMAYAPHFLMTIALMSFTAFFLLVGKNTLTRKATLLANDLATRRRIVLITKGLNTDLSRYLGTIMIINTLLGCATGLVAWACGLPNPVIWGLVTGILNFIPYVGPVITVVGLGIASLLAEFELWRILVLTGSFMLLTALEGFLITPTSLGRAMALNPALVFLSVIVSTAVFGLPGALIGVPILMVFNVISREIPSLQGLNDFLRK
ncbi:MAG: AI-2E family transporter [Gammaproteobacteria bacterium]|nr:AI-2E family transporter [Gammaproteobacteria bacterium]